MASYSLPATPVQQPPPPAAAQAGASSSGGGGARNGSHLLPVPPANHGGPQQQHHQRGAASQSTITLAPYSAPNTPQSYDPKLHAKTAPALLVGAAQSNAQGLDRLMQGVHAMPPETGRIGEQTKRGSILMSNGRSTRATSVTKGPAATAPPPGVSVSSDHIAAARPRSATTVGASAFPVTPERERASAVQNLSGTFDAVAGHGGPGSGSGSSGSNSSGASPAGSPSPQPHSLTGPAPSFPTQHPPVQIRHRPSLALNPSHYTGAGSGSGAGSGLNDAFSPSGMISPSPMSASFRGRSRACSVAVDQTSLAHMSSEQKDALIETQARELEAAHDHLQKAGEYGSDLMMQLEELQNDKAELQEQLNMARASSYAAQSHGGTSNGAQTVDPTLLSSFEAFSAFVRVELAHSNNPVTGEAAQDLAAFQRLLKVQRHSAREERSKAAAREEEASRLMQGQRSQLNAFAQSRAEWAQLQTKLSSVQSAHDALDIQCLELQTKLRIQSSKEHATGQVTTQQYEAEREEWQNELDKVRETARAESMKLRNAITNLRQQLATANAKLAAATTSSSVNVPLSASVLLPAPASLLLNLQEGADEAETAEDSNDFKIVEPAAATAAAPHRRKASVSLADDLETAPTEPPSPLLSARPSPRSRAASVIAAMPAVPEVGSKSAGGADSSELLGADAESDVAVAGGVLAASSQGGGVTVADLSASLTALQVQLALTKEAAALLIESERDRQAQRDGWHEAEQLWQFERARTRDAEKQDQAFRIEQLASERALQAEIAEGRSYEATIAELRTQLRQARDDREDSSASLVDSLRSLAQQLADKESEVSALRERVDAHPAALAAAVSAATLKATAIPASSSASASSSSAAGLLSTPTLLAADAHNSGHWTPPRSNSSGSNSSSSHSQTHTPADVSSQPPPLPQGAPPLTFGALPVTAAVAASSSLSVPASAVPQHAVVLSSSVASKDALVLHTNDVLQAVRGGHRCTRWFVLLLFVLQLLLVSCWLVLTHGGSAALADHPFAQTIMRSLLGEEARTQRYS